MVSLKFDKKINGIDFLDREHIKEQLRPYAKNRRSGHYFDFIDPPNSPVFIPFLDESRIRIEFPVGQGHLFYEFKYPVKLPSLLYGHGYGASTWKFNDGTPVQKAVDALEESGHKIDCINSCNPGGIYLDRKDIFYTLTLSHQCTFLNYSLLEDKLDIINVIDGRYNNKFYIPTKILDNLLFQPDKYFLEGKAYNLKEVLDYFVKKHTDLPDVKKAIKKALLEQKINLPESIRKKKEIHEIIKNSIRQNKDKQASI